MMILILGNISDLLTGSNVSHSNVLEREGTARIGQERSAQKRPYREIYTPSIEMPLNIEVVACYGAESWIYPGEATKDKYTRR